MIDSMVPVDAHPLNLWRRNSGDLVLNILVNGWVTLCTANYIINSMVRLSLSNPIPHILDRFLILTFGYLNAVYTSLIALILFVLSLIIIFFDIISF